MTVLNSTSSPPQKKSSTSASKIAWTWFLRPPKIAKQNYIAVSACWCKIHAKPMAGPFTNDGFPSSESPFAICSIFRWTSHVSFRIFPWKLVVTFVYFVILASRELVFTRLNGPLGCFIWGDGLKEFFPPKMFHRNSLILMASLRAADAQEFFPAYGDARGQFSGYEDGLSSCPKLNSYK